jgi:excisionase family DNA binding protein
VEGNGMTEIIQMAFNRKEASQYLGISEKTLDKLLSSGEIKFRRIERAYLIPKVELDRFLEGAMVCES